MEKRTPRKGTGVSDMVVEVGQSWTDYMIKDNHMRAYVRLITLHNPTDEWIHFHCRAIRAPAWGSWGGRPTPPSPSINEMNILALYDGQGRIVAAGDRPVTQTNLAPCGFVPDEGEGQRAGEFEVTEDISRLELSEICENFVVDIGAERPALKRKPE